MKTEQISRGLGWFSIGLGAAELFAPRQVARLIGVSENHSTLLRAMGLREIGAGVALLGQPQYAPWMWSRVGGDAIDLALLGAAARKPETDRRRLLTAMGIVAGITVLDAYVASQLDRAPKADPRWRVSHPEGLAGLERPGPGRRGYAAPIDSDDLTERGENKTVPLEEADLETTAELPQ